MEKKKSPEENSVSKIQDVRNTLSQKYSRLEIQCLWNKVYKLRVWPAVPDLQSPLLPEPHCAHSVTPIYHSLFSVLTGPVFFFLYLCTIIVRFFRLHSVLFISDHVKCKQIRVMVLLPHQHSDPFRNSGHTAFTRWDCKQCEHIAQIKGVCVSLYFFVYYFLSFNILVLQKSSVSARWCERAAPCS